jgi:hypothetical protein
MRALVLGITLFALIATPAAACGPAGKDAPNIPPVGVAIDGLLAETRLPAAEFKKVVALRTQIGTLAAAGNEQAAREAEEQAMNILGYGKVWLRCGSGTFVWMKLTGA